MWPSCHTCGSRINVWSLSTYSCVISASSIHVFDWKDLTEEDTTQKVYSHVASDLNLLLLKPLTLLYQPSVCVKARNLAVQYTLATTVSNKNTRDISVHNPTLQQDSQCTYNVTEAHSCNHCRMENW